MTRRRRGTTLIELVAALALLAMLVAAAMPLLQRAALALHAEPGGVAVEDLGILADRVMKDPDDFGIEALDTIEHVEIDWPADLVRDATATAVVIELFQVNESDHAWLRFSCNTSATLRWIKLEDEP